MSEKVQKETPKVDVKLERLNDVEGRITVDVVEDNYKDLVKKELHKISASRQFPGFRKGEMPMNLLRRRFGQEVTSEVVNELVYRAVINYITDNKLNILGEPLPVEVKKIDFAAEKNFSFQYDLGFGPNLDITLDEKVSIPYYHIEVPQEMVDEQDKAFRQRGGEQVDAEEVTEDAIVRGTIFELNEDGSVKEGEDAIQNQNGILTPRYMKAQSDLFIGKKVGDKVVFNPLKASGENVVEVASMLAIDKEKAQGVTADFEFSIASISINQPAELGEKLYDFSFGKDKVHNEEEYYGAIRQMISGELERNSELLFRATADKYLVDTYGNFTLPENFLKRWLVKRNENLTEENIDAEYTKSANGIKLELIRNYLMEKMKINVSKEALDAQAKRVAAQQFAQYGMVGLPDDMIDNYAKRLLQDKQTVNRMIDDLTDDLYFKALKEPITVEEKTVSLEEFRNLASPYNAQATEEN